VEDSDGPTGANELKERWEMRKVYGRPCCQQKLDNSKGKGIKEKERTPTSTERGGKLKVSGAGLQLKAVIGKRRDKSGSQPNRGQQGKQRKSRHASMKATRTGEKPIAKKKERA